MQLVAAQSHRMDRGLRGEHYRKLRPYHIMDITNLVAGDSTHVRLAQEYFVWYSYWPQSLNYLLTNKRKGEM